MTLPKQILQYTLRQKKGGKNEEKTNWAGYSLMSAQSIAYALKLKKLEDEDKQEEEEETEDEVRRGGEGTCIDITINITISSFTALHTRVSVTQCWNQYSFKMY